MTLNQVFFMPDDYLREMEELCVELRKARRRSVPVRIPIAEVLIMAQAFGAWHHGQVEKAGGTTKWLAGQREKGSGRVEQRNKHYREALDFVEQRDGEDVAVEPELEPALVAEAKDELDLPAVWSKVQDLYEENAPATWPKIKRRLKIGQMSTKLREAIHHAGDVDTFLGLISSALQKVPEFYLNTYPKGRGVGDCLLCLFSGDKKTKDLGTGGMRLFTWADSMDSGPINPEVPALRHPAEKIIKWTGTRWTRRTLHHTADEVEAARQELIKAELGPCD